MELGMRNRIDGRRKQNQTKNMDHAFKYLKEGFSGGSVVKNPTASAGDRFNP